MNNISAIQFYVEFFKCIQWDAVCMMTGCLDADV